MGRVTAVGVVVAALAAGAPGAVASPGAWSETGQMQTPRREHAATLLPDGRVLVTGGRSASGAPLAATEIYNPANGAWTAAAPMPTAMTDHTAVTLDGTPCGAEPAPGWCGKILLIGNGAALFDPGTGTWSPGGGPAVARIHHSATVLADGRVLVVGGSDPLSLQTLASAEVFDPATLTWAPTGAPAEARERHVAARLEDGRVLIAGGQRVTQSDPADDTTRSLVISASSERYDPPTGTWSAGAPLPVARASMGAAFLSDRRFAIAGGSDGVGTRRTVDVFDPAGSAGTWAALPPMDDPRSDFSLIALADGRLLAMAGHASGGEARQSAETLAPGADAWSFTGSLQSRRRGYSATRLADGRVLVAGGGQNTVGALASTELFDPVASPAPGRVSDLAATAESTTGLLLRFRAPGSDGRVAPPARRFLLRQSSAPIGDATAFDRATPLCGGVCVLAPGAVGDSLEVRVSGLTPGTTYHYALRAENDAGRAGPLSNTAGATTPAAGSVGAITDLSGTAIDHRALQLRFSAPPTAAGSSTPVSEYLVKQGQAGLAGEAFDAARSLCGGVCRLGTGAVGDPVTLTVTGLRPATTYFYVVRPLGSGGQARSNEVSVRTPPDRVKPGRVGAVKARALSATRVRLTFTAVGSDGPGGPEIGRYVVKQSRGKLDTARRFARAKGLCRGVCRLRGAPGTRLALTVTGLCPRTRYAFAVQALDEASNRGARSRQVQVTTRSARRVCARR